MFSFLFMSITVFILPILLIYSLIKPNKFHIRTKNNHSGKWSRKQFYLGFLIAWILLFIVYGMTLPSSDVDNINTDQIVTATEAESKTNNYISSPEVNTSDVYSPKLNEIEINRATFVGSWPFSVEQGVVGCIDGAAYFISGNSTYALTGFSNAYSERKGLGWLPLKSNPNFWLENPEIPTTKISINDVNSLALILCDK